MLKMLVFLLYFLPSNMQPGAVCNCAEVTNLHSSGQSSGSYAISWTGHLSATGYTVKYIRHVDGYTSPESAVSGSSYTFSNLTAGRYTFYVAAVCGEEKSSFIGVEDIMEN